MTIELSDFVTWKWANKDYDVPLKFNLSNSIAKLVLHNPQMSFENRGWVYKANLQLEFSTASDYFIRCLRSKGDLSLKAAEIIYDCYKQVTNKFETLLLTVGGVGILAQEGPNSFQDIFKTRGTSPRENLISWWIEGSTSKEKFNPKILKDRRKIRNPLFKRERSITTLGWRKMQIALSNSDFPSVEIMELLRIKSRLQWGGLKIATIEAAVFAENLLRTYSVDVMKKRGISGKRIKELKDDLNFNTLLNVVLPLSVSEGKAKIIQTHIVKVNVLRKIRNDLVHGEITETDIDDKAVIEAIDSTIKLVELTRSNRVSSRK